MRILAIPRDSNPYQQLLYSEMRRRGAQVRYLGDLTPSHTANLLLLPFEMAVRRLGGARLIHLHWVFGFVLPGAARFPAMRRLAQAWFQLWLRLCQALHMHLVWTAHNVLPHEPVFADDVAARRELLQACDLVIVHSPATLTELMALGTAMPRSAVIRHGPIAFTPTARLRVPGSDSGPCRLLFIGQMREYKGIDDLLDAFDAIPQRVSVRLTIAGQCDEPALRSRLTTATARAEGRIALRLGRVPDEQVPRLLSDADVVVLPFRRVTTSGSAFLALAHGRPLIVPSIAAMADLPDDAVFRYDGGIPGLAGAMMTAARTEPGTLAAMSRAAHDYAYLTTWPNIAMRTMSEMQRVVDATRPADPDAPRLHRTRNGIR